jgi:hypothetical protein
MLTLDLAALRVESFATLEPAELDDGTSAGTYFCMSICASCQATCDPTCPASCGETKCITACQGGSGTGTAVETCRGPDCEQAEGTL